MEKYVAVTPAPQEYCTGAAVSSQSLYVLPISSLEIPPSRPQPTWYRKRTHSYHEATVLPEGSQDHDQENNETSEDQATTTPTRPKKRQSSAVGV